MYDMITLSLLDGWKEYLVNSLLALFVWCMYLRVVIICFLSWIRRDDVQIPACYQNKKTHPQ